MVSLNRMERGKGTKSALAEISDKYGFPTDAIVTMADVYSCLGRASQKDGTPVLTEERKQAIREYYAQYGAEEYKDLF